MSPAGGDPVELRKRIYILPRIRLSGTAYGQERFSVAKAHFLPDEEKSWAEVLKLPRPKWLNIYRHFPHLHSDESPEPTRGTLLITNDEEWLRTHVARLIGVIYVLGLDESRWQVPADAFHYSSFLATGKPSDLVTFCTKSGEKIEDLRSILLLPPLELRGVTGLFRVNLRDEWQAELIRRFDANPHDRLAAASYHLFRSQFDNPVTAPPEQDFAAYCACLEAALGVTGPDYSGELIDKLAALYGEHPLFERWLKGMYSERSVFNHGISEEPTLESADDRVRALVEFRQRPTSWDILRKLCLDVIKEQLLTSLDETRRAVRRLMSPTRALLRQVFFSEGIWADVARVFTQPKSVDKLRALTGEELDGFLKLCRTYLSEHNWQVMKDKVEPKKVFDALKAMAALFGECAKSNSDAEGVESANQLFEAAKRNDGDAVDSWARHHAGWEKEYLAADIQEAARAVSVHTARFFSLRQ